MTFMRIVLRPRLLTSRMVMVMVPVMAGTVKPLRVRWCRRLGGSTRPRTPYRGRGSERVRQSWRVDATMKKGTAVLSSLRRCLCPSERGPLRGWLLILRRILIVIVVMIVCCRRRHHGGSPSPVGIVASATRLTNHLTARTIGRLLVKPRKLLRCRGRPSRFHLSRTTCCS
ncbi:hypothetical protein BZA05DRAFT_157973 [Tricharina praecox]|uniref:uncharacterized protein n=1 Tax=Tricharina praecox TaxID=43433 RepID=UPI002220BDA5|nr:uncharacterized protein BZA05DRAFT_157973 [Tricharina praecox]KAI5844803.1 hypothetical protein BZA05DRAFT_157973 [Tricharina praecox]